MTWAYNAKTHRWEALSHDWRAIAQRAPNRHDWEAAIEAVSGDARYAGQVVFQSSDAARAWCEQRDIRDGVEWHTLKPPHGHCCGLLVVGMIVNGCAVISQNGLDARDVPARLFDTHEDTWRGVRDAKVRDLMER